MPDKRLFTVDVNFPEAEALMKQFGVEPGGRAQQVFAASLIDISKSYVPAASEVLKDSAYAEPDGTAICYVSPYARVHWYGKVMVDPITQKAAFHDEKRGRFWSRKDVRKEVSERDMQYRTVPNPNAGPRWVERAWIDRKAEVLKSVKEAILKRGIDE